MTDTNNESPKWMRGALLALGWVLIVYEVLSLIAVGPRPPMAVGFAIGVACVIFAYRMKTTKKSEYSENPPGFSRPPNK
jgi:hypothetical protein